MSTPERRGPCLPPSPAPRESSADLAALHRLLGSDLVAELRHLDRLRERLHAFDEDPRNVAATHSLVPHKRPGRQPLSESRAETASRLIGLRREELVNACAEAERATAVQLLQVHRHHERRARDVADAAPYGPPGTGAT